MSDTIERLCAHPVAFWLFSALFAAGLTVSVDVTNIAISYFTAGLLLLTLSGQRRSNLAVHAKLDDLECAVDAADSSNARLEQLAEREIEAKRV